VPYEIGTLKAIGYRDGKEVNSATLNSAGQPNQIKLTADRTNIIADNQDLSYVTVELLDQNGVRNPLAENRLDFSVDGPGQIIAVANGNPMSTESYQGRERKAWQGRCLVIVKPTKQQGTITLNANASGLPTASLNMNSTLR
jgi:beta-galactosidase